MNHELCAACRNELPAERFSKKQWQLKQHQRRCKQCIDENKGAAVVHDEAGGQQKKPELENDVGTCANCGKRGDDLKKCNGCLDATYCGVDCQVAHRPAHKVACKKRAAELLEGKLFRDPPPREECPICLLPLPWEDAETTYQACCGKILCWGCSFASGLNQPDLHMPPCAFCRTPAPKNHRQANERVDRRMERHDAEAFRDRAAAYELGESGMRRDEAKAFELFARAAALGSAEAHNNLGNSYKNGRGVAISMKKAKHHYQLGAIGGNAIARNNLGVMEAVAGNFPVAMRHFMLSASAGFKPAMERSMQMGWDEGYVSREDFQKTSEAYNNAVAEMESEQRDLAAMASARAGRARTSTSHRYG